MPRNRVAYPPEFRQKLIELVASGRSPEELAKEFEPSAQVAAVCRNLAPERTGGEGAR